MPAHTPRVWVVLGLGLALLGLTQCRSATAPDTTDEPPSVLTPTPGEEGMDASTPGDAGAPGATPDSGASGPTPDEGTPPQPPRDGGSAVLGQEEACSRDGWCWMGSSYGGLLTAAWALDATRVFAVGPGHHIVLWQNGVVRYVPSDTPHWLSDVWGSGPTDAWAVGASGTIVHWDGERWTRVREGGENLRTVFGTGPSDVWAGGANGTLLHWDGHDWRPVESGTTHFINAIWASGPRDVWVTASAIVWNEFPEGLVRRWNGETWSEVGSLSEYLYAIRGFGPDDVWVGGDNGLLAHWSGQGWTYVSDWDDYSSPIQGLWGRDSQDLWVAGNGLQHWDGHQLTHQPYDIHASEPVAVAGSTKGPLLAVTQRGLILRPSGSEEWEVQRPAQGLKPGMYKNIWASGPKDVWVAGDGPLAHWDGHSWSTPETPLLSSVAVTGTSATDVWAVGSSHWPKVKVLNHFNGRTWTQHELPSSCNIEDVWAAAPDDAWVMCRESNLLHWTGVGWEGTSTGRFGLRGIHGSSRSDAWVVGQGGTLLQWNGQRWVDRSAGPPLDYNAVWSFGPNDVWIAARQGVVLHWDGVALSRHDLGVQMTLHALYGRAPDDVWVVGEGGTLAHWDGKAWSPRDSGTAYGLEGITGAGGAMFTVGSGGVILRRPAPPVP